MMGNRGPRGWVIAAMVMMAASAVISHAVLFQQVVHEDSDLTRNIPRQIGKWNLMQENAATASEIRGLETRDIVKRTYTDGQSVVELVVAYIAHSNRKSAHAQEACLRGSGALVGSLERRNLKRSPVYATVISIDYGQSRSWVYYWYKIGNEYTSDYLKSSFKMFLGGLVGKQTHGASLVRVLTPAAKGEPEAAAHDRLEDFTQALLPQLDKLLP